MKRFILIMSVLLLVSTAMADVNKGKRYYMKELKQKFKMDGLDFVQLHTQAEWEVLFNDDARGFIAEFSEKYPKYNDFLHNPKLQKKLRHVGDFAIEYGRDSGKIPSCGDDGATEKAIDLEVQDSSSATFF